MKAQSDKQKKDIDQVLAQNAKKFEELEKQVREKDVKVREIETQKLQAEKGMQKQDEELQRLQLRIREME